MMQQWIRKFNILIGNKNNDGVDVSALRCTFKVTKTNAQTPNEAQIKIYNLTPETAARIKKEFTRVLLQAGYESNFGVIFDGTVKQFRIGRESGTDTYLEIQAADGDVAYNFAVVNTTLAAGSSPNDHINAAAGAMNSNGTKTGYIGNVGGQKLARGKVMYGNAKDYMRQTAQNSNADWSIQDGKVQVIPIKGLLPTQAVVLTSQTGLIDTPKQSNDGIEAKTLLNPLLKIGGKVIINNSSIESAALSGGEKKEGDKKPAKIADDGAYKIIKIEYSGDSRGTEWYCNIVCIDVDETVKEAKNG